MISLLKSGQLPNKSNILNSQESRGLQMSFVANYCKITAKYNNGNYLCISNFNHSCPATTNFLSQSSVKNTSLKVILHRWL